MTERSREIEKGGGGTIEKRSGAGQVKRERERNRTAKRSNGGQAKRRGVKGGGGGAEQE